MVPAGFFLTPYSQNDEFKNLIQKHNNNMATLYPALNQPSPITTEVKINIEIQKLNHVVNFSREHELTSWLLQNADRIDNILSFYNTVKDKVTFNHQSTKLDDTLNSNNEDKTNPIKALCARLAGSYQKLKESLAALMSKIKTSMRNEISEIDAILEGDDKLSELERTLLLSFKQCYTDQLNSSENSNEDSNDLVVKQRFNLVKEAKNTKSVREQTTDPLEEQLLKLQEDTLNQLATNNM